MPSERLAMKPQHQLWVRRILREHVPDREVWVFGSRAGEKPKLYSDLDLVILGDTPVPTRTLIALKDAFEESELPYQVDVVEWASVSEKFRQIIAAQHAVLQEAQTGVRAPEPSTTQAD